VGARRSPGGTRNARATAVLMTSATLKAAEKELREAGISYRVTLGKRHYKVWFSVRGVSCLVVCSKTGSDHRAALNSRLEVRRKIRAAINKR